MKKLIISALMLGMVGLSSCEKEDTTTDPTDPGNGGSGNNVTVTNNTIVADGVSANLNKGGAYKSNDANSGKDYISIFFYQNTPTSSSTLLVVLDENLPTASGTLKWQNNGAAPGDIESDEFTVQPKVEGQNWYGIFVSDGYEATGNMEVTIAGGKITFAYQDIQLGDDFIQSRVTNRVKCGGKVTMNLADLQASLANGGSPFDLVAE